MHNESQLLKHDTTGTVDDPGTLQDWDTMAMAIVHNRTSTPGLWYTMGLIAALVCNRTGAQWADSVGLLLLKTVSKHGA